jgi:hypothetical protein
LNNILHGSHHRRRTWKGDENEVTRTGHGLTANKDFALSGIGVGEVFLEMFLCDVADTTFPAGRGVVEDVKDLELELVDVEKFLEVIFEENVLFVDVGVYERDGGGVERVPESGTDDLDHGSDTSATSEQAEVASEAGLVTEVALGTLYANSVADLELRNVL